MPNQQPTVTINGVTYSRRASTIAIQLDYEQSTGESVTLLEKNPLLTKLAAFHAAALEGAKGERLTTTQLLAAYTEDDNLIQEVAKVVTEKK